MFGWEFPPFNSGGLGTACFGLTKGLKHQGTSVTFVVPKIPGKPEAEHVKLVSADIDNVKIKEIDTPLKGYLASEEEYQKELEKHNKSNKTSVYGRNLFSEVRRYAKAAAQIAKKEAHDIIHAHDWMTYKAAIAAHKISGKPVVLHIHATEFDRTGGQGCNPHIYDIEKQGMSMADKVISVSQFTKDKVIKHYGISPDKIQVVHNAVEFNSNTFKEKDFPIKNKDKVVLFLGRITIQKGPEYLLYAAKKVLEFDPNVKFVYVGEGDMEGLIIEKAAELGIGDKVLFTGFLRGPDIDKAYQMADLYVMPSVSEPFGITPLESMRNGTPVLISKTSGVSEVIKNCLKVDFWDIDQMVDKILCTLHYSPLKKCLRKNGTAEVKKFTWNTPAKKCQRIYNQILHPRKTSRPRKTSTPTTIATQEKITDIGKLL